MLNVTSVIFHRPIVELDMQEDKEQRRESEKKNESSHKMSPARCPLLLSHTYI